MSDFNFKDGNIRGPKLMRGDVISAFDGFILCPPVGYEIIAKPGQTKRSAHHEWAMTILEKV